MRKILMVNILLFLIGINLKGQSAYEVERKQDSLGLYSSKYGLFAGMGYNMHSARDFYGFYMGLPDGGVRSFSGIGVNLGGVWEKGLNEKMNMILKGGVFDLSGSFQEKYNIENVGTDGEPVTAKMEATFEASLTSLGVEPLLSYEVSKGINLLGGGEINYLLSAKYSQNEIVTNKNDGVPAFTENNKWERNTETNKAIPTEAKPSSILLGLTFGGSYDIELTRKFITSIDMMYSLGLMSITSKPTWGVSSLRLGITGKYVGERPCPPGMTRNAEGQCEELPCPAGQIRNEDGECECRKGMFVNKRGDCEWPPCAERNQKRNEIGECIQFLFAEVKAEPILTSGLPATTSDIELKEAESITEQSIINYIFFEEKSASIPSRYIKMSDETEVANFTEEKGGISGDVMKTYYNVLNILGYRLSINPFANVTLQTYNMGGSEAGMSDLPDRRIDSVSRYLQAVWKIPEFRIKRQIYNLAPEIARSNDKMLLDEYRRVEINVDTANLGILRPVQMKNLVLRMNRPRIDFLFDIMPMTKIESWKLKVTQQDKILHEVSGKVPEDKTKPVEYTSWFAGATANQINPNISTLDYELEVKDRNGEIAKAKNSLNLKYVKFDPKLKPEESDSTFRIYYFVFNDSDVQRDIRNLSRYLNDIDFDAFSSKVTITGYTDKKGDPNTNRLLSDARARELANYLKEKKELNLARTSAAGRGFVELFDNSLPEGRIYNRLVVVEVSTPMKEKEKLEDLIEGCFVLIFSDENEMKSKSVLDYLQQRGAKDIFIEKYSPKGLDKTYYRVRSKSYKEVKEAVEVRGKLNVYLRQLSLEKPPSVDCSKKEKK
ncbi:OmpA family protein [Bacteroidetes/Chlorobi group bacterium ChocPot_Mid]|nr:MAG: OmpA family protein [Bacteroidetes/Chlorobi group bacterium ChocPot_Mid]